MRIPTKAKVALTLACAAPILMADSCSDTSTSQQQGQQITEAYQQAANSSVPYPLSQMRSGGWLERTLLKEHLLRQNNAHRLAFVVLLNQQGQPIAQYPVQGMIFELNSAMTPTQVMSGCPGGSGSCGVALTASGDNGTYGPEPAGIGFFTTSGVEVKWNGLFLESDAPLNLTTKPLIVYDAAAAPSVTAGGVSAKP